MIGPMPGTATRPTAGFTLIEAMVTLVLIIIVVSLAAPAFQGLMARSRRASVEQDLLASLNLARSEAITRNERVFLCPSTDGASCTASNADWSVGWIVFADLGTTENAYDANDVLLRVNPPPDSVSIEKDGVNRMVRYSPNGTARGFNASYVLCETSGNTDPLWIVVPPSGRPRIADTQPTPAAPTC